MQAQEEHTLPLLCPGAHKYRLPIATAAMPLSPSKCHLAAAAFQFPLSPCRCHLPNATALLLPPSKSHLPNAAFQMPPSKCLSLRLKTKAQTEK